MDSYDKNMLRVYNIAERKNVAGLLDLKLTKNEFSELLKDLDALFAHVLEKDQPAGAAAEGYHLDGSLAQKLRSQWGDLLAHHDVKDDPKFNTPED
jgi:hypothetical protein